MGFDYSYSQPSSSKEYNLGFACLLQGEADAGYDEAESSYNVPEAVQYPPQPECDDGIPKTCYCGAQPVLATSFNYLAKDHSYVLESKSRHQNHDRMLLVRVSELEKASEVKNKSKSREL